MEGTPTGRELDLPDGLRGEVVTVALPALVDDPAFAWFMEVQEDAPERHAPLPDYLSSHSSSMFAAPPEAACR